MALRFRRSIKLAPGVRWNISSSGSSWTLGPRGASVNFGKRGTYLNSGIPGTGLSSRHLLSAPAAKARECRAQPAASTTFSLSCGVTDDGTLTFSDASGAPVAEHLVEIAKKQNKEAILGLISRKCDEINGQVESLAQLHHDTPQANERPRFVEEQFQEAHPTQPAPQVLGLLDKIFASRRRRIEDANIRAAQDYEDACEEWREKSSAVQRRNAKRKELIESVNYGDVPAMETFLEERFHEIAWPRETLIALEIVDGGRKVMLDVDLPEVEDMPSKTAHVPARGLKLAVKDMTDTKVRQLYMGHVHSILFRLIGETFAALQLAETVVAAGYSQRRDPGTGQMRDDYLLSVSVRRGDWLALNFDALEAVDVVEAMTRFELIRDMTKTGIFKPIAPHDARTSVSTPS